ncbi:PTS sugar transporter subunit IIC [Culicoidibacter larvae]|nr:PTS transporter subunit EIIC [Culicoidibacter larvae]
MKFLEEKFMPLAAKLAGQRHLLAIRDAFVSFMPLTMASSFAVLINSVILGRNWYQLGNAEVYGQAFVDQVDNLRTIFSAINAGTIALIALFVPMAIAFNLAMSRKVKSPLIVALAVGGVFVALLPLSSVYTVPATDTAAAIDVVVSGWINSGAFLGATNLFTSLLVGIVFSELLIWLMGFKKIQIKMPDAVPPMVAGSFSAMIPIVLVIFLAGIINWFFANFGQYFGLFAADSLSGFIQKLLQEPILAVMQGQASGPIIAFVYVFLVGFFWVFGIHGSDVLAGVSTPIFGAMQIQNQDLFAITQNAFDPALADFTSSFFFVYVFNGGAGLTLALILAVFIFSKREDYRTIASLSTAPGIFNINEPIIFGMPVVLNPILAIPFILAPVVAMILPSILTLTGILPKVVINVPWITPVGLGAFLATGGNWLAGIVAIINVGIAALVYIPFVIAANKEQELEREILEEQNE